MCIFFHTWGKNESDAAQFRQPNNSTDVHKEAP